MPKIEKMFAFIAADDGPDDEGVVGASVEPGIWAPLVGADMSRVEALKGVAQEAANASGKEITIVEFSIRKEIGKITPRLN